MGKHETSYPRSPRDFYPTPAWVVDCLAKHLALSGMRVWEPACGDGRMARTLRKHGACVIASDLYSSSRIIDFLGNHPTPLCDAIITNPPFSLAMEFVQRAFTYNSVLNPKGLLKSMLQLEPISSLRCAK